MVLSSPWEVRTEVVHGDRPCSLSLLPLLSVTSSTRCASLSVILIIIIPTLQIRRWNNSTQITQQGSGRAESISFDPSRAPQSLQCEWVVLGKRHRGPGVEEFTNSKAKSIWQRCWMPEEVKVRWQIATDSLLEWPEVITLFKGKNRQLPSDLLDL